MHLLREEDEDADDDVNKEEERSKEVDCDMMMLILRELSFFFRFAFFSLDFYVKYIFLFRRVVARDYQREFWREEASFLLSVSCGVLSVFCATRDDFEFFGNFRSLSFLRIDTRQKKKRKGREKITLKKKKKKKERFRDARVVSKSKRLFVNLFSRFLLCVCVFIYIYIYI